MPLLSVLHFTYNIQAAKHLILLAIHRIPDITTDFY